MINLVNMYKSSKYNIKIDEANDEIILFNTFTGGIIALNSKEYSIISKPFFKKEELGIFDELFSEGYVVFHKLDEYKRIEFFTAQLQQDLHPKQLTYVIAPTMNCNLYCNYCFEGESRDPSIINLKTIHNIIDFIILNVNKLKSVQKVNITWFGGEPMLAYEQMLSFGQILSDKLDKMQVRFSSRIVTNGILFDKEKVHNLKKICKLSKAQITLDGLEKNYCKKKGAHLDDYNKVLKNISDAANIIKVSVRLNTDKENLTDMYDLTDVLFNEYKLKNKIYLNMAQIRNYRQKESVNLLSMEEFDIERERFNKYLYEKNYIHKKRIMRPCEFLPVFCGLVKTYNFAIDNNGNLYKCEHYLGRHEKVVGDVQNGLYYNEALEFSNKSVRNDKCGNCSIYPTCRSGCPEMYDLITANSCGRIGLSEENIINSVRKYLKIQEKDKCKS